MQSGRHQRPTRTTPAPSGGSHSRPSGAGATGSSRRTALVALASVAGVVAAVVVALSVSGGHHHPASAATPTATTATTAPGPTSGVTAPTSTTRPSDTGGRAQFIPPGGGTLQAPVSAPKAVAAPSVPVRVQIPSLRIDGSPLESLHLLSDGAMKPPTKFGVAGWYSEGTRPGAVGPAVIAGHVDSVSGPGIFLHLGSIKPGASIIVTTKTGQKYRFTVTDVHQYPKNAFPVSVVYGPTPLAMLRLITCAGDFDQQTHHYLDNLVVSSVLDS